MMIRFVSAALWNVLYWTLASSSSSSTPSLSVGEEKIHIAIVSCGRGRAFEALTSVRSTILSTLAPGRLFFHIVHRPGDGNDDYFTNALARWQWQMTSSSSSSSSSWALEPFGFAIYEEFMPPECDYGNKFAPCATQRLFLHHVLPPRVERIIYMDSDTITIGNIQELWDEWDDKDGTTLAAFGPDVPPNWPWGSAYLNRDIPIPETMKHGINSGVALLNIKLMRQNPWDQDMKKWADQYGDSLTYFDQDLINIYFHHYPERLQVLSCRWNSWWSRCLGKKLYCLDIERFGILHGVSRSFHTVQKSDLPKRTQHSFGDSLVFNFFLATTSKSSDSDLVELGTPCTMLEYMDTITAKPASIADCFQEELKYMRMALQNTCDQFRKDSCGDTAPNYENSENTLVPCKYCKFDSHGVCVDERGICFAALQATGQCPPGTTLCGDSEYNLQEDLTSIKDISSIESAHILAEIGRSFYENRQYEQALEVFEKLQSSTYHDNEGEAFVALYLSGKIYMEWNRGEELVTKSFFDAFDVSPRRAEPLYELSNYFYRQGKLKRSFLYAWAGANITDPTSASGDDCSDWEILRVETDVYSWKLLDLVCTTAYYASRLPEGRWACEHALKRGVPQSEEGRIRNNLRFYL